jgi:hypothetical protein
MKITVYTTGRAACVLWACIATIGADAQVQQFAKYQCSARGENGEVKVETRETINSKALRESAFTLLIDFEKNLINFQDSTAYPFKVISNQLLEETTSDQYFFKSYDSDERASQDLRIDRRSGVFYFSRTWDANFSTYKFIELRGLCRKIQENLDFKVNKRIAAKAYKFGDVVIPPQFSIAGDFSEGLASVWARDGGVVKSGAIDPNGDLKIPLAFSLVRSFSSGRAGVCTHGVARKCGYINKDGQWVIEPVYDEVGDFKDGFATVVLGKTRDVPNTKTGKISTTGGKKTAYIDVRGEILGNTFFDSAYGFSEGLGSVGRGSEREDRLWGFVDRSGNEVIPLKFGPGLTSAVDEFREGLAPALQGNWREGKYGYIDKSGRFLIPPTYSQAKPFFEGKAMVCRVVQPAKKPEADEKSPFAGLMDDKRECSFIDRTGKLLFPFKNYYYGNFSNGLATACRRDTYLNFSSPSCGYIDARGRLVISEKFIMAEDFKNGYATVSVSSNPQLWGLINAKGEFVIKPIYSELGSVSEGFLAFRVGDSLSGKWGYMWAR